MPKLIKVMGVILQRTIAAALFVAATFYLFALPVLVANHTFPPSATAILFAGFMYLQFWMVAGLYTFRATTAIYERKIKPPLVIRLLFPIPMKPRRAARSIGKTLGFCIASYFLTIYGFAVFYVFLSYNTVLAFSADKLDIFDAIYFSVTTIATVGYGDIVPRSVMAKSAVMIEILTGLFYVVFIFALLADFVRGRKDAESSEHE